MAKKNRYTPTQQKILGVLLDERPHTLAELEACLPDPKSCSLHMHISNIRAILHEVDRDIVSRQYDGVSHYRLIYLPYPVDSSTTV